MDVDSHLAYGTSLSRKQSWTLVSTQLKMTLACLNIVVTRKAKCYLVVMQMICSSHRRILNEFNEHLRDKFKEITVNEGSHIFGNQLYV